MKNLIVNIFKTLFFFDLALILSSVIPAVKFKKEQFLIFNTQLTNFIIIGILSIFFLWFIEKKQLKIFSKKGKFKSIFCGFFSGLILPIIYFTAMKIYKFSEYIGYNKVENLWCYILAIILNVFWIELLLRGYLFTLFKKYYGFLLALIFTTLLFISMNHEILKMNKIYMWTIILFNVYLCFLRNKFESVLASFFANLSFSFASIMLLGCNLFNVNFPKLLNIKFEGKEKIVGGEFLIMGSSISLISFCIILITWLTIKYKLWHYFTKQKIRSYILAIKNFFIDLLYDIKSFKYNVSRSIQKTLRIIRRYK